MRLIILMFLILLVQKSGFATPEELINKYIDALKAKDWQVAESCWHPEAIKLSERLNIKYDDVPLKVDCASPLIANVGKLNQAILNYDIETIDRANNICIVKVNLSDGKNEVIVEYFAESRVANKWYLVNRSKVVTSSWNNIDSEYLNLYFKDSSRINKYALYEIDRFIEKTLIYLDADSGRINLLKKNKLDYFLCSEAEFIACTGYNAHGIYDIPSDAIITRHLPHKHELVHFLINYAIQELPLYTLPVIQEGMAVALGGRWGKSADVLLDFGGILLAEGFIWTDSIWTYSEFYSAGGADMTYPVSGLMVDYLLDNIGVENFKKLYLELSGTRSFVQNINQAMINDAFSKFSIVPEISNERILESFWNKEKPSLITMPEDLPTPDSVANFEIQDYGYKVHYLEDYRKLSINIPEMVSSIVILYYDKNRFPDDNYESDLFERQFPEKHYDNKYHYGLLINNSEIGLYDYWTNELLAKTVNGLYPGHLSVFGAFPHIVFILPRQYSDLTLLDFRIIDY